VVFDEASQLKLEDNLPAIERKNIIIAGDEHQMPLPIISAKFLMEQLKMKMILNLKQVIT
jgi:superfamily I DNA and/or RNA helicase